jgi:hypothetical protein
MERQPKISNDIKTERNKMNNTYDDDGRVYEATVKQIMDYWAILTNERGDELWRFFDGDDDKPRWKVWAVEAVDRTTIKNYEESRPGADYFDVNIAGKGGPKFLGPTISFLRST